MILPLSAIVCRKPSRTSRRLYHYFGGAANRGLCKFVGLRALHPRHRTGAHHVKTKFVLLISALAALAGCDWMHKKDAPSAKSEKELAQAREERIHEACGSTATYDKLKALVFDQAARIRNSDPRNLDPIAAGSVVRMEKPVVKSRDEELDVTVCSGRFILELPPGAENAFDGMRRVSADVEYSAQAAADGTGLVYQMDGAEPIVYRLATFGMN